MKNVSESLAGRADIVELETLSYAEILAALPETSVGTAIVRGGFAELYANPDIDLAAFYKSYLATYLERDVRSAPTTVGASALHPLPAAFVVGFSFAGATEANRKQDRRRWRINDSGECVPYLIQL